MRHDSRRPEQLRPLKIRRRFTRTSPGSVWIQAGGTTLLCTASVDDKTPEWMAGRGRGWVTAEYNMLPGSTSPRKRRERDGKLDGRTSEIQRLIGRSLRAVTDLDALGERMITVDCEVLEADGGTRTLAITGGFIALADAVASIESSLPNPDKHPLTDSVAAVSVGVVDGRPVADLDYIEDVDAEVDANIVMTGAGHFVEIQATGEETSFSDAQFQKLLKLAKGAIEKLREGQRQALGKSWRWG